MDEQAFDELARRWGLTATEALTLFEDFAHQIRAVHEQAVGIAMSLLYEKAGFPYGRDDAGFERWRAEQVEIATEMKAELHRIAELREI